MRARFKKSSSVYKVRRYRLLTSKCNDYWDSLEHKQQIMPCQYLAGDGYGLLEQLSVEEMLKMSVRIFILK